MNLNEVKKHVYFNLILYILIGLCFIISIIAILITPVKAVEQSTDITNDIKVDTTICLVGSSTGGQYCVDGGYVKNVKTTYNGRAQCIGFAFNYYFHQNRDYTINIIANSNDFRNNNLSYYGYSYTTYPGSSSPVNVQGRFINKQKIQIVFPYDPQETHSVSICSNSFMTGDTNYNIKQVYLTYDDGTQDISGIVDNATQNTTDIINNANSNAISIIDTMTSILENCYVNLMQSNWVLQKSNLYQEGNDFQQQTADTAPNFQLRLDGYYDSIYMNTLVSERITTTGRHYFRFLKNSSFNQLVFKANGYERDTGLTIDVSSLPNDAYFYISADFVNITQGHYQWKNMMISYEEDQFTPWGNRQCSSKIDSFWSMTNDKIDDTNTILDEQKDLQQEQNDYLMDDTDPSVDNQSINGIISDVTITDPLNYLLTLPLSLLNKLNQVLSSNSCQRVSFGTLYNTELYLPCINFESILGSSLWGTIDLIVGVGLLAIILKKFYDSISNMLTLGKEKEVRDKLDLPTPMQFLASILGGGRD